MATETQSEKRRIYKSSETDPSSTEEEQTQQEEQTSQYNPPIIISLYVSSEGTIFYGSTADVWVEANDPDGDSLSYKWQISGGNATIVDVNSSHTEWKAPDNYSGAKIIYVSIQTNRCDYRC